MGSTRLPGKVLLQLGGKRVIEHVVDRATGATSAAAVVLTTGDRAPNDAIREWARRANVRYETGPEEDLLERHWRVAKMTGSDVLVRVTGDCPFVPTDEIDRVIEAHRHNDARYTTNVTEAMPVGTAVDVFDVDVLAELSDLGETHPVKRPRANPSTWGMETTTVDPWTEFDGVHIAVDTPADYWRLTDAVATVGEAPKAVTRFLAERAGER
jgi:spore coat polysaccharide biosynthesis protein SpsF